MFGTDQMKDLPRSNQMMQTPHQLLHAGVPVVPMNIQNVDIGGPEALEGGLDGDVHGFRAVARVLDFLRDGGVGALPWGGVLGRLKGVQRYKFGGQ